ncbi:MAG: NUDIX hydrolase [Nocardioides sp.]|nr:NUDIX hydrolase [Nocardioides sp.]
MPPLRDVPEAWSVASSTDRHRDAWGMALREDSVRQPGGGTAQRLVLEHPGAAVVLALDEEQRVPCLWQYRHAGGHRFVELPAGLCDGGPDEEPLDVAVRELREEAQLQAETWTHLSSVHPSPGILSEVQHLFCATGLAPADRGDFALEHEEADMHLAWVPFADLHAAVVAGEVTDSPLVAAVLLAAARGLADPVGAQG